MQITPIANPHVPHPMGTNASLQMDARSRAINKLMEGAPVANPTQVAPEEMTAIQPPEVAPVAEVASPGQIHSAEATSQTAPEATKLSAQYNQLARKERSLRAHAQKMEAQRAELAAKEAALEARQSQYIDKDSLLSDPFGTLSKLGVSYNQITDQMLNQPSPEEQAFKKYQAEMDAKLKRIEEQQEQSQKAIEASQKQAYDQAVSQIKTEVRHLVNNDPAYETIRLTNQSHEVTNLILETFNKGLSREYPKGSILPIEVAAQMVEDHIVEEASKLYESKKIQERWNARRVPQVAHAQPPAQQRAQAAAPQQQQMRTLTNATSVPTRPLSSRERAILAFKGELK